MKYIIKGLAIAGAFIATVSTTGCMMLLFDEPEMPESLL